MYLMMHRYRVRPDKLAEYLEIQRRASKIYAECGSQRTSHWCSSSDPFQWLEVHTYADEATCRRVLDQMNSNPEILALWSDFVATLDPMFPAIVEEFVLGPLEVQETAAHETPAQETEVQETPSKTDSSQDSDTPQEAQPPIELE